MCYTTPELVDLLSRQQNLNFAPGDRFSYTNSGYFLLAEIVTRVSGLKASLFAQENIFEPLGMTHTRFYDDPNAIIQDQALGYSPRRDGGYRLDILRSEVIGDLGVITTIEDFLHWDNNFYENKLGAGTSELIATMFTRGRTEPTVHRALFRRVEQLVGDRENDLEALRGRTWDAVIDNSGR